MDNPMPIDAHPFMVEFTLVSLPSAQRFPRIKYQTIDHNDGAATTFLTGHLLHTSLHGIFLRENFLSPSFVHRFLAHFVTPSWTAIKYI